MRHEPGTLKPQHGGQIFGRISKLDGRFCAECWAEADFPSHHAEERHETKTFDTAEEARSWIDELSRGRGYEPPLGGH
jgi:hypothetical protein